MNLVMLTRGGLLKALRRLHSSSGATTPKNHPSDRIIWLQAFCFAQRNIIPSLLQGSRRLRGVLQPPASAVQIDVVMLRRRLLVVSVVLAYGPSRAG